MPTYEYICSKCGHEFEKFQPIAEKPLAICPEKLCARKKWGRGRVKKKISTGGGLIFKGSGFYITDYRSEKYKEAAKKDSAASKTTGSEGSSKPASGPEPRPAARTGGKARETAGKP
jgi:putative FmdB family regulatory protein